MYTILSLVTSVKDYIEVVHKLIESNNTENYLINPDGSGITNYNEFGSILTYTLITLKNNISDFFSLKLSNWNLPVMVPDVSSAMISEISVLEGNLHNSFNLLDLDLGGKYGEQNGIVYGFEKLVIGLINSCFFIIPTSTAHIITLRRFVMQGLEAGYIAGLGTIAGNIFWIASIVLGFRFFIIPWLSFDIFRYILGFMLLIKYMWDSYNTTTQNRMVLEDLNKQKIFLLNFLLALTEQSSLYPFITNLSIGPDSSILESFPAQNYPQFIFVHFCYLLGLVLGSLSLLHLTCWFMENPAFKIYMWAISSSSSSSKVSTSFYYKFLNFGFLYLTMICAMTSIPYYGLDYTITNPLGLVYDDRILDSSPSGNKTLLPETAFINSKASDKNTRRNRGRHGRRERWKRRIRKYRTFDASLYDNGVYDLFTIEDLNYGFDRFWLRRKMRNHRVRFRFFPGPWMRSFKKQLIKKGVESYAGPRQEFFRILFEQVYHPSFHKYNTKTPTKVSSTLLANSGQKPVSATNLNYSSYSPSSKINLYSSKNFLDFSVQKSLVSENSTLRKFIRKVNNRIKTSEIVSELNSKPILNGTSKIGKSTKNEKANISINNLFSQLYSGDKVKMKPYYTVSNTMTNKNLIFQPLPNINTASSNERNTNNMSKGQLLHPLKFYLKKQQAFERKLRYYTPTVFRKFSIENNAPYFRVMMKRFFYYYKPTLRWEKTMKVASLRKARRKTSRIPRKLMNYNSNETISTNTSLQSFKDNTLIQNPENIFYKGTDMIQKPTHNYTVVGKRASRYRYQIYKDVLQHWYYSPFNRFLLKLDVDSFIRRQPKSHFLTKNEENNLHLKRFLLYEHYNTLRWYTYMQHYRSMKTKIGGSKSFSSNLYNQQFMGTFKKIRHLFAITPSQNNKTILKFDTPLYNNYSPEYYTSALMNNTKSLDNFSFSDNLNAPGLQSILHEELLGQNLVNPNQVGQGAQAQLNDLVGQSTFVLRDYLKNATPIREEIIKKLIKEKNYTELTEFLYKGQKTRGIKPITNTKDLNKQEFELLFSSVEKEQALNELNISSPMNKYKNLLENKNYKQDLWISLLKKWKRSVNDGTFLKNYISRRVEKREKRKQKKEKNLRNKLAKLKNWLENTTVSSSGILGDNNINLEQTLNFVTNSSTLSSGSVKAINDGIKTVSSTQGYLSSSPKTNLQNSLILYSQIKKEKEIVTSLKTIKGIYFELNNDGSNKGKKKIVRNLNKYLTKISSLSITYKNKIQDYLQLQKVLNLFSPLKRKTLNKDFWRKQERALNKQKKSRKEFSRLTKIKTTNKSSKYNNDYYFSSKKGQRDFLNQENPLETSLELRKKRDPLTELSLTNTSKTQFNEVYNSITKTNSESSNVLNSYKSIFTKQFKRKKSPQRRARIRRNRSVIRKRTLADTLKREFKNLQKTNKIENNEAIYEPTGQKQRQTKIRKRRVWKDKRAKYSKKQSKYRKRRRNVLGKIRILNKQLKRSQSSTYVKNWWWNTFLPSIRANTDTLWQIEKEQLIKEKLKELTDNEILKRDPFANSLLQQGNIGVLEQNSLNQKYLQIGDKDFKPLALPLAMQLKENLLQKTTPEKNTNNISLSSHGLTSSAENLSLTEKLYNNILVEYPKQNLNNSGNVEGITPQTPFLTSNTSIPFYAGWDESLRKFVVTNRLLSRRQAGFVFNSQLFNTSNENTKNSPTSGRVENQDIEFTSAPLKGMNAPTTLYWQIPFTTYDPDQFYALGMDGFAPIGWRRFNFRHTILKSWLYYISSPEYKKGTIPFTKDLNGNTSLNHSNLLNVSTGITTYQPMIVKGKTSISGTKNLEHSRDLVYKLNQKNHFITTKAYFTEGLFKENSETNKNKKNLSRRLKKRYKRVRRHPRAPVWFPSGPLLNQVLPVHYIYVFYKRTRLPRDRYIKRRLQKQSTTNMYGDQKGINGPSTNVDFTLRKRVKTKRKYHRKKDNIALRPIPKRIKFYGYEMANTGDKSSNTISRPIKLARRKIPIAEIIREQRLTRTKQRKSSTNKQPSMRVKQLRRRVQQQIIRSVWRYRPRAGGFVWPGDYLRLELVKAPKLQQNYLDKTNLVISDEKTQKTKTLTTGVQRKMKRKKKRAVKEWQIQPKTYLLEKHNIRVLKKKLQKANHSNQFKQRLKELNYIV